MFSSATLSDEDDRMSDIDEDIGIIATRYDAVHSTFNFPMDIVKLFPQS